MDPDKIMDGLSKEINSALKAMTKTKDINEKEENDIEKGCEKCGDQIEKCGDQIMKEACIPIDSGINPNDLDYGRLVGNVCDECGHVTNVKNTDRFQCTPITREKIFKIFSETEIKQLRLYPKRGVAILNKKLDVIEKPRFEVDFTTTPPTIYKIGNQ